MFVCDYTFAYSPTEVMRGGKLHWKRKLKNKFTSQRLLQKIENKSKKTLVDFKTVPLNKPV